MKRDEFKALSMLASPVCVLQTKAGVVEGEIFWKTERVFADPDDARRWIKPQVHNYGVENMDWRFYCLPCNGALSAMLDAPPSGSLTERIVREVIAERVCQDEKWGPNRKLSPHVFHTILSEEVGECAESILERDFDNLHLELVQVAAVAVAAVESLELPEPAKSEVAS